MRIAGLFEGYGGLTMGVQLAVGGELAWYSEYEPPTEKNPRPAQAPARLLAYRHPGVPNLGDITAVDWSRVEPVDVLCGGSPCQDVSTAGRREGMRSGTRSGLWESMREAIAVLQPRLVVWENVRGVTSACAHSELADCPRCVGGAGPHEPVLRALGRVLGDLADLGFDAEWHGLRASDIGAPHERFRVFVVAYPNSDAWPGYRHAFGQHRIGAIRAGQAVPGRCGSAAADTAGADGRWRWAGHEAGGANGGRWPDAGRRSSATDAESDGRDEGWAESAGLIGRLNAAQCGSGATADASGRGRADGPYGGDAAGQHERSVLGAGDRDSAGGVASGVRELERTAAVVAWGPYEPAIRQWEHILGRVAPAPTEPNSKGGQRLSPAFVEWMMGLPAGHVTDPAIGLTRNEQLKALGNGVVPQQAAEAIRICLARAEAVAA